MDDWGGRVIAPVTLNKYLYGNVDVANNVDPTGYFANQWGAALSVQATLNSIVAVTVGYSALRTVSEPFEIEQQQRDLTQLDLYWGKFQIRRCQRSFGRDCRSNLPIILYGADVAAVTNHLFFAQHYKGLSPILTKRPGDWGDWRRNANECEGRSRLIHCDEYPFNSSWEGGPDNYENGRVSLKLLSGSVNSSAGQKLGQFYSNCGVRPSASKGSAEPESYFGVVPTFNGFTQNICGVNR